jgi:transposase
MDTLLSDELWEALAPYVPEHRPSARGGRPRIPDRDGLRGILFVLREGLRWQSLPKELGCGSGSTCWRRFQEWTTAGVWEKTHRHLVVVLGERGLLHLERAVVDSSSIRALRGGIHTGPNPTDRAKRGGKRHLITDAVGLPLVVQIGPANRRDEQWRPGLLWWLWVVVRHLGQRLPQAFQGDRGYGWEWCVALVLSWGMRSLLAVRGSPHGSGLGRTRYVVERTPSWFVSFRRLIVCYERSGAHYQGLYQVAACVICARRLTDGHQDDANWQPFERLAA